MQEFIIRHAEGLHQKRRKLPTPNAEKFIAMAQSLKPNQWATDRAKLSARVNHTVVYEGYGAATIATHS